MRYTVTHCTGLKLETARKRSWMSAVNTIAVHLMNHSEQRVEVITMFNPRDQEFHGCVEGEADAQHKDS